jgi:uncharacterized ion transporter superfamily protein YfcC
VAIPRGIVAAADVMAVVLLVGGAWVVVDRLGTLPAVVDALVAAFAGRGLWVVPVLSVFFATMGALENMQEEIIPLVPALLVLGRGLGIDAVSVVAMSAGAAMVGSAFGPTNPFQAGIALRLAQLPPLAGGGVRLAMFVAGVGIWIAWTLRHARRHGVDVHADADAHAGGARGPIAPIGPEPFGRNAVRVTRPVTHVLILALVLLPMAAYVYGALRLGWGFNELSAVFLMGGLAAGLVGGLGFAGTTAVYVEGMQALMPAAVMVGLARSISLVLEDGHVVDALLVGMVAPLARAPAVVAAVAMIPLQALLHVAVPSVSGQAVLTMPLFVPLADVLGLSRQVPVLAYQTGAGLMELATPTNGALMAVLLAAGVSLQRWLRFALGGLVLLTIVGVISLII